MILVWAGKFADEGLAKTHTIFGGSGLGLFVCRSKFLLSSVLDDADQMQKSPNLVSLLLPCMSNQADKSQWAVESK